MEFINMYGGLIVLWFLFQVALPTYNKLLCNGNPNINYSNRRYFLCMVPGLGILFMIYWIIKLALSGK